MVRALAIAVFGGCAVTAAATPASAATVYVFVDPMTLERRGIRVDPDGPDRAYLCMLPPATSGCHEVPVRRERR